MIFYSTRKTPRVSYEFYSKKIIKKIPGILRRRGFPTLNTIRET